MLSLNNKAFEEETGVKSLGKKKKQIKFGVGERKPDSPLVSVLSSCGVVNRSGIQFIFSSKQQASQAESFQELIFKAFPSLFGKCQDFNITPFDIVSVHLKHFAS